jgi:hypothetical protein
MSTVTNPTAVCPVHMISVPHSHDCPDCILSVIPPGRSELKISDGGLWEEQEWMLVFNESMKGNLAPCPHATHKKTVYSSFWGKMKAEQHWNVPRVVVATNEGGCATTGVCLDCIVERSNLWRPALR